MFPQRFEPLRCALSKGCMEREVEKEFDDADIRLRKANACVLRSADEGCPSRSDRALC